MRLYAESSAVLAWLLGEPAGEAIRTCLGEASLVAASDLTLVECDRALHRAARLGELSEADAADRRARLAVAAAHWSLFRLSHDVIERARQPFPGEPIRTLDALHLSSALALRAAVAGLELLSFNRRIRTVGRQLGFVLQPVSPHDGP